MEVDPCHRRKILEWSLTILLDLKAGRKLLDPGQGYFREEEAVRLLGIGYRGDETDVEYQEFLRRLRKLRRELAETPPPPDTTILGKNLRRLKKAMGLNRTERAILELYILLHQYEAFDSLVCLLGNDLNSRQTLRILSTLLEIPAEKVAEAFRSDSRFSRSALLTLDRAGTRNLRGKFDPLSYELLDKLFSRDEPIETMMREHFCPVEAPTLELEDFDHLRKDLELLIPYLSRSLKRGTPGVNLLLYGPPGTGKTELAKVLARHLGAPLYEVSYLDESGDPVGGQRRLRAYRSAQAILGGGTLLMFDEAEEVFTWSGSLFGDSKQSDKAWLNRMLESNPHPAIWISNDIDSVDPALIRRFGISLEIPVPPRKKRREILRRYSGEILKEKSLKRLSRRGDIAPALVESAARVASMGDEKGREERFLRILDRTLRAQGSPGVLRRKKKGRKRHPSDLLPPHYDPALLNTPADLEAIARGIEAHPDARLCLYGPPGTGKSAYGLWLARRLGRPALVKKGSDLLSMWVGGTEKNIAEAFREARKKKAVLIFDEVDSFLRDRREASRSWELTQVNEMLVQMERFQGIFLATTNLMEGLDPASLRRFDIKLEFGFLRPEQAWRLFAAECRHLGLEIREEEALRDGLRDLSHLTPGDFAAVRRQHRFRPLERPEDLLRRLGEELAVKPIENGRKMGFV
jgi:SpoVK/Ycf46/Vps4 family AAA+-type ATPase